MKPKKWKPKLEEYYFYIHFGIDSYCIVKGCNGISMFDFYEGRIKNNNCFKTEKEAQIALRKIKKVLNGEL